MSKLSFRARALDASKPMPIYLAEELPDLPDYSAINRAVPQMPSGMEKEEESEHHLQRAISGSGLIIPTPEVCQVTDLEFYERCYPPDYRVPKQHIHMQPLWEEQETPEYDIDTEDERWLKQQRHPELTELKFEQMMDKLEKSSGQTVVTLNEAKLLLERNDDLVIAVYDYWLNKRLNTQHALVLSVKTEHRLGQSSNNPYLAFRRRTEKMQTRKNRKNDESSYEKMLKLRRDLARALSLLEFVARRERAKRDLVRLTALIAERRYAAGDFANQLLPEPPPRPTFNAVPLVSNNFRREPYTVTHYPPRPPATTADQPRQREKRSYKRRKHRYPAAGSAQGLRDSGVYTSSEEETGVTRAESASPPDDGPFAFRRKPGCYYEMPTSTLCGDPVDAEAKESVYEHEIDERCRYTLTSIRLPYARCIGFARRRRTRGGRVALDRFASPLDDLWPALPFRYRDTTEETANRREEVELETKAHRTPKEISRDYHSCCKYPWRRAFRKHLARKPDLWTCPDPPDDVKPAFEDMKPTLDDFKPNHDDLKPSIDDVAPSLIEVKTEPMDVDDEAISTVHDANSDDVKYSEEIKCSDVCDSVRTRSVIDSYVRGNLDRVMRKRALSAGTDSSYDSDESLYPVEREFESFFSEVNDKWSHFRPKTPTPTASEPEQTEEHFPLSVDTAFAVELRSASPFLTSEFTLAQLDAAKQHSSTASSLDVSNDQLLTDKLTGISDGQMESMLSVTALKGLGVEGEDRKLDITDEILDVIANRADAKDSFLSCGQSSEGRAGSGPRKRETESFGSSVVTVRAAANEPIYVETESEPPAPAPPAPAPGPAPAPVAPRPLQRDEARPHPHPTSLLVRKISEMPVKAEKRKRDDTVAVEGQSPARPSVRQSPVKKHAFSRRPSETVAPSPSPSPAASVTTTSAADATTPQILTVAVSDALKVRLQNHLLSTQAGVLVQNGPFPPVAVALPVQAARDGTGVSVSGVTGSSTASPRRVSAPLVHLAPAALAHKHLQLHHQQHSSHPPLVVAPPHAIHHVAPNKLKVLHAHSLTHSQRTQLLAQNRVAHLPTVVSLATLADPKSSNTALLKAAPGSVAQLFEIKSGQLGKGPHLVNVVRQPQPGKTTVTRLDLNDKKRQVVAAFDGQLKGNVATATRPQRVSVSLDGRQLVRAATIPSVRATPVRHQFHVKNRTLQVSGSPAHVARLTAGESVAPATSITIAAPAKASTIPSSVVANLLHKNVQLPKGGQKIAISGATAGGGQALSANVQAIAFTTAAQLKARQARLIAQPRQAPVAEIMEATSSSSVPSPGANSIATDGGHDSSTGGDDPTTNGAVPRRNNGDPLPMEVT